MKNKLYNTSVIFFIFIGLSTIFITSSHFVDKEVLPKWYGFYGFTLLAILKYIVSSKTIELKIDIITVILFFLTLYMLFGCSFSTIHGVSTIFKFIAFILLFLFFKLTDIPNTKIISIAIVGISVLQAIYGIFQIIGIVNNNAIFPIVGSFDNPAGFASCLSAGFAFCFTLFGQKRHLNCIAFGAILIIGISVVLSQSRAGIISIFIVTIIFLYHELNNKLSQKRKKWILSSLLITSFLLLSTLIILKKDSAIGRLLIWETTIDMIAEKPILGWGNDSFRSQYMPHQADYFKNHPNSRFELIADNVTHPFNEYLLLTVEHGIIGLVLLFILIFSVYRKRSEKSIVLQLCILSVLIFACFSYPFRYPFIWLILAYCLAKLSNDSVKIYFQRKWKLYSISKIAIIFILIPYFYLLIKDFRFEYKWNEIARLSLFGKTEIVRPQYKELNSEWNGNPLFMYNYGAELNYIKQYTESVLVLQKCAKYYNYYDVQMLLGDNYFKMKDWKKAETCYTNASLMCPNRFLPLSQLMNVYDSIGLNDEAIKIAYKIYNKPVKIKSTTVSGIRFKAKQRLNNIESDKK